MAASRPTGRIVALLTSDAPPEHSKRPLTDVDILSAMPGITRIPKPRERRLHTLERLASIDLSHAYLARQIHPDVCLSLSERLASAAVVTNRNSKHICVAHNFNTARRKLHQVTQWMGHLDSILVVSTRQRELLMNAGLSGDKIHFVNDYVDTHFFDPSSNEDEDLHGSVLPELPSQFVLAVGQECRDYPLLIKALAATDIPAVLVPSSAWVTSGGLPDHLPSNITILSALSFPTLRKLYKKASCIVVPVSPNTQYAAGVNGLLEALSMARPVIVTETPGLSDYLDDRYMTIIPSGDLEALQHSLRQHWTHTGPLSFPKAREHAIANHSLQPYVNRIIDHLDRAYV